MEFLSQMDEESKERLRKKELQVHTRRKDAPQPPPSDPRFPQARPHPIPKDDNMDLSTSMVDILQRVKRIHGMLEILSLEETRGLSNDRRCLKILQYCYKLIILSKLRRNMHPFSSPWQ